MNIIYQIIDNHKICTKCLMNKHVGDYHKDKRLSCGIKAICKSCYSIYNKSRWRKALLLNREKASKRNKKFRRNNPELILFQLAKCRAKNKNVIFTLSIEDIIIPEFCPVLGIKLIVGNRKLKNDSPSIDRFDQTKGYTKENIRIISWRANRLKSDATFEEIKKIYEYFCLGS